jgi:RNase P subunit RPR2
MEQTQRDRQRFLWSSSQQAFRDAPALSRVLLHALDEGAQRDATPLPTRATQRFCASCFTPLVPGVSSQVKKLKHSRRPKSRRYSLRVQCKRCGHKRDFPLPTPPSSRAAISDLPKQHEQQQQQQQTQQQQSRNATKAVQGSKTGGKRSAADAPGDSRARKRTATTARSRTAGAAAGPHAAAAGASADALFGFDFVPLG